ncbi:MAG: tyrosine--tRNA ligase [Anaerolineaceae bacterium]|jgi:tyrosyl-tRNA synthetase
MNLDEQVEYLMQGVDYGDPALAEAMAGELRERLLEAKKAGRPLKVYCGYDPTSTDLHLGHTVTMRKLRQFQELGHDVTFVIGTFTSLIGDPSDKDKLRPQLSPETVFHNAETYAEQAFRVLDPEKTHVRYNSEWLSQLTMTDLFKLASNFTVQQFLTRDNFHKRWNNNEPIYLHEFFYSLMQGYDAHMLDADVQVGGSDQLFNIMTAARKIMTFYGQKPNIGIILGILPGTDGELRMSKSLGNHIPLNSNAEDMYGKVMSVPDKAMPIYARLATKWTPEEVTRFEAGLETGSLHPRDAKMRLARAITAAFYGENDAEAAQSKFIAMFQKGDVPVEMPEYQLQGEENILDILIKNGFSNSRSQARRLIEQQGVRIDGITIDDTTMLVDRECVLQSGKRHFLRIVK